MRRSMSSRGVSERCELLYGVPLPLVRRGPVPHRRRRRRRRFGSCLLRVESRDEVVDVRGLVVGEAGVGLAGEP